MPHPERGNRIKIKRRQPSQPSPGSPPSPASQTLAQGGYPDRVPGRHSFDSNKLLMPPPQKFPPAGATPSLFFSLLNNDTNPSGSSTLSSHHGSSRTRSPPPSITSAANHTNAFSQHMNLSSSKDRFLYIGKGHQLHHHSEPSTPFAQPISLSSGAAASVAALSASAGNSPYHTHHYHTPSQKRPSHSRRSSLSYHPGTKASPANGYGEVPDQRQNAGFFNMAIFDPSPDHSRSARSSVDHLAHNQSSIRSASRPPSIESINSSNSVPLAPPPPPPPPFYRRFLNHFSNRVIKRHIKFAVALYLTSLLALIPQVATVLGPTPYLANVTVVFMHPARTVGSMLEATFFSVVGAILAAFWIIPCEISVAKYNQSYMKPNGDTAAWAIEAAWFFLGIWVMTTAKSRYAKLNCAFIMFTIVGIFAFTKNTKATTFDPHFFLSLVGPMVIGVFTSLLVCIVFWPETASQGLGRAFNESLDSSRELLNLCTRSFLLNHKTIALPKSALEKAQAEVRQAQKKLYNAYRETRYEVTYSRADPADYKEVRVMVAAMMRHLGSMSLVVQNERLLLLGNSERDDDDLNTMSGDSASEQWLSEGSYCTNSECAYSDSEDSHGSDSENETHRRRDRRHGSRTQPHDDPEHEADDYFGSVMSAAAASTSTSTDSARGQDTLDSTPLAKDHGRPRGHHHHRRRANNGEPFNRDTQPGVMRSSSLGGGGGSGNGSGSGFGAKSSQKHRTSAAELRRIRQLLHRAENSTAALLTERQENQRRLRQQQEEQLAQITQIFQNSGFATAPPTPNGRGGIGIYKHYKAHQRKKDKSKEKGKEKASTADGNSSSASSVNDTSFFGAMGMTPIIRSTFTSPASSRPSSINEESNLDTVKSFKSLFSVRSDGRKFKPERRPASFRGLKMGKSRKGKEPRRSAEYDRSGYSSPADHGPGFHVDYARTAPNTLGGPFSEGEFDRRQLAKAALAFHQKELKRLSLERKRVSREEKILKRKVEEEQKKKIEAAQTAVTDTLPPKEVTFGDRKLFMSFLDIVHEPLQQLSESCSKVMVAMEREIVAGLNVENDRLERIRRKNTQRAAALKAAEAAMASEQAAVDGHAAAATATAAPVATGLLRQPTMLIKRAISFGHKSAKNHNPSPKSEETLGNGIGNNTAKSPTAGALGNKHGRWNAVRSLVGLRRRSFTATEEIEFANAMNRKVEGGETHEKERSTAHSKEKAAPTTPTMHGSLPQQVAISAGLEPDTDADFILPADMTYVEFLTQELEKFDVAETDALRNLVSSHPALDIGPREEVFLIFFFLFALREIARELLQLGRYIEEMDAKWKEEKRRRRLWWPKVVGNFWQWFAWASYAQIKTNEGYGSMTVNMTKNLEHRELPRTVEEEKAVVLAKAKAAKEKAEQEKKRQEEEEAAQAFLPLRRSATFSAVVHRRGQAVDDIELGLQPPERTPRSILAKRLVHREGGQRRNGTFFGFELPKRMRSQERSQGFERRRRQSTGDYVGSKELSRVGIGSPRYTDKALADEPLEIVVEASREGDAPSGAKEKSEAVAGREILRPKSPPMATKYAVAEIPSFYTLQQRRNEAVNQSKGVGPLSPDLTHYSGAILSPIVDSQKLFSTAPPSVKGDVTPLGSQSREASPGGLHIARVNERSKEPASTPSTRGQASMGTKHTGGLGIAQRRGRDDAIQRAIDSQEREIGDEIQYSGEVSSDSSNDDSQRLDTSRRSSQRIGSKIFRTKGHKNVTAGTQQRRIQKHHPQEQPARSEPPRKIFVQVQKPKTWRYRTWEALQFFKSQDFRFGLKMAMAQTFIGLWAWLNWSSRTLATDRGQWAMMTVMAVLSPTVGATFSVCAMRVAGTLAGTLWALLTYLAYPRNPYVICAMMLVIVFASVFLMLETAHPKLGIIMVLSYSSITFIKYEDITTDTIYEVCYQRAITVIVGILISVVMNSLLWPITARRELRKEIALLIGRQGVLFAELVNKFLLEEPAQAKPHHEHEKETRKGYSQRHSDDDDRRGTSADNIRSAPPSIRGSNHDSKVSSPDEADMAEIDPDRLAFQHVEHQLQTKLIKILQLLELSESEPRLKGNFPVSLYQKIIQCCQNILDRLISMRMAAQLLSPDVRELVTGPMNYYRRDMSPLPPYLPSARMARLRVIYNVREAIAAHQAATGEDHYTYIYYYAFSSALEEVIEELGITAVATSSAFNYPLSGDQLGFGPAVSAANLQLPPMGQSSVAAMLGSEIVSFDQYDHQGHALPPSVRPPSPAQNSQQPSSDALDLPGTESAIRPSARKNPSNVSLRKRDSSHFHRTLSVPSGPNQSGKPSKPDLKVTTMLASLKNDPEYPSATFTQSPAVMEEGVLGGMRQMQRLKEAIKTAQEASEHHVLELPSPTVAPTGGVGVSVPTKNLPPSMAAPSTVNESKMPMSSLMPRVQVTPAAPTGSPLDPSPPAVKHTNSENLPPTLPSSDSTRRHSGTLGVNDHSLPSVGIVTPFGSSLVPEAPLPLYMIPYREHDATQMLAERGTIAMRRASASSNNGTEHHHSLDHTLAHPLHHSHSSRHQQRRPSTSNESPQTDNSIINT
ncbi:hypothetical protein BGZ73_002765 [Actinomortierella ambigua]|nr:hypothetical protein BGZ73_002765 [Actinomortierella ambigua]